jgi:TolB-like protein/Tfp pilus assembly protein PilF
MNKDSPTASAPASRRGSFRIGGVLVDPATGLVTSLAGSVRIEPRAMSVLVALADKGCEPVTRDELIATVWKHSHVSDEALSRCISILRKALRDDVARPRLLETLPRRGYRLMQPPEVPAAAAPAPSGTPVMIVVLPFQNLSGKADEEHVADGITELLISHLAARGGLRVISRTSSMHYKGTRARLTEIGRELGVDLIVEGSVLRSDRHFQVVVQLIDARTDVHVHARTYTREFADLLVLQNEMTSAIAEAIGNSVRPVSAASSAACAAVSEDALQAYLRARYFWAQRTPDGFAKAMREYEACIRGDPGFAPAHAGLADTLLIMALYGVVKPASVATRAKALAEQALALDASSAEALTARGGVALFLDWDVFGSAAWFRRALAANPSNDVARLGLADTLMIGRDFDAGLRELGAAIRLNPFDLGLSMNQGEFLVWAGRPDEAMLAFERTLHIGAHFWPARVRLAQLRARQGDRAGALHELELAGAQPPARRLVAETLVQAALGEAAAARAGLAAIERERGQRYVSPTDLARGHALLGDAERACHWIDIGIAERAPTMLMLGIDVSYERIRDDPRFQARMRSCGVV